MLYTISILSLVAVAIERYRKICKDVKTTMGQCMKACALIAVLSLAVCSPTFYSFTTQPVDIINKITTNTSTSSIECTTNKWNSTAELIFNIIHTLVAFLLPLVVLTFTHGKIYVKLKANEELQVKRLASSDASGGESIANYGTITEQHEDVQSFSQKIAYENLMKAKMIQARNRKVVRMLLVITILFVVLWAPWFVTRIVTSAIDNTHLISWKVVQLIAFVSITTNFFIYVCMNKMFRQTFLSFLCCCCAPWRNGGDESSTGNVNKGFQNEMHSSSS